MSVVRAAVGVVVVLLRVGAGRLAGRERHLDPPLVAPRGARYGDDAHPEAPPAAPTPMAVHLPVHRRAAHRRGATGRDVA